MLFLQIDAAIVKIDMIKTDDGSYTLHNAEIDEAYHSRSGAISESRHVFLQPLLECGFFNGKKSIAVLDVGFGLGLNALCYFDYFLNKPIKGGGTPSLRLTSIEINAYLLTLDYTRDHVGPNQISYQALQLLSRYKKDHRLNHHIITAKLLLGEALEVLQNLSAASFDIILQDPFSPKKNPNLWSLDYFQKIAGLTKPGGVLLTYSVARPVCDALKYAGFAVQKIPGFGAKREQLVAVRQ